MLGVGAFFGGAAWQHRREQPIEHEYSSAPHDNVWETITMPDGKTWTRMPYREDDVEAAERALGGKIVTPKRCPVCGQRLSGIEE